MREDATTFRIELGARDASPEGLTAAARFAEEYGYDGVQAAETKHDPLIGCAVAGAATERVRLSTAIAVAFARSPMSLAQAANDVQLATRGRFALGLGSQVQAHIEKRFSMPWSAPAPRMREFIAAIRAIWRSWETGERLAFRGEHYTHTLMTPFFDPGPNPFGSPDIWLAAVGPAMTKLAGEAADGFVAHAFTTRDYLSDVSLPRLAAGAESAGRERPDVVLQPFVIAAADEASRAVQERHVREQIAFYGSTPSYRAVMEHHGWEEAADRLHAASRRGEWAQMGAEVTDDMLDAFSVAGRPEDIRNRLEERFGGLATTVCVNAPATEEELAAIA
ncbi:TIGR03617 family F420-dependent LLM class oxidoreductase [Microbacterium halophytorum]|uniref:TIGR03617 family F420-dependent LLM class oxidoreductase n=1 Tax=Microbacterium halophytorum TaxID=2067568 RepID=UPI000CFDBDE6|nr:TIGR03617 family F420-dependent LLM class oxidoreductase [Microbacterium halophytorum]